MHELKITANAKINIGLHVRHKRQDGYHEIESIFQEISFADTLTLKQSNRIHFESNSSELKNETSNLCIKATEILQNEFNISGLDIYLDKQIPIGSGLGGGSSDAAAVLKSANLLFKKNIPLHKLKEIAAQIGSDVPFFIEGNTCHISGRGEIIEPIMFPTGFDILLVFPKVKISTTNAYKRLGIDLTKNDYDFKFKSSNLLDLSFAEFKNIFYNDFEKTVFDEFPELLEIKKMLYRENAEYASLSGSGSTIYGIYSSVSEVKKAFSDISKKYDCVIAKPVS